MSDAETAREIVFYSFQHRCFYMPRCLSFLALAPPPAMCCIDAEFFSLFVSTFSLLVSASIFDTLWAVLGICAPVPPFRVVVRDPTFSSLVAVAVAD